MGPGSKDQAGGDLWELTVDDLLVPPTAPAREREPAAPGPYVVDLSVGIEPFCVLGPSLADFDHLHIFQVTDWQDDRLVFRLRLGPIESELEADMILTVVRRDYPNASSLLATDDDFRMIAIVAASAKPRDADPGKAQPAAAKAAPATAPAAAPIEDAPADLELAFRDIAAELLALEPATPRFGAPATPAPVVPRPPTLTAALAAKPVPPHAPAAPAAARAKSPPSPPDAVAGVPVLQLEAVARPPRERSDRRAATPATSGAAPPTAATVTAQPPRVALRPAADDPAQAVRTAAPKSAGPPATPPSPPTPAAAQAPKPRAAEAPPQAARPAPQEPKTRVAEAPVKTPPPGAARNAPRGPLPRSPGAPALRPAATAANAAAPLKAATPAPARNSPATPESARTKSPPAAPAAAATSAPRAASPPVPAGEAAPAKAAAKSTAAVAAADVLPGPPPAIDSTQTLRALVMPGADDSEADMLLVIQLATSDREFAPESVANLAIFNEYRLYTAVTRQHDKVLYALRLGFFSDRASAEAVAGYLRSFFDEPAVTRVSTEERERFGKRRVKARKDSGETGVHAAIELSSAPAAPSTSLADLSARTRVGAFAGGADESGRRNPTRG